MTRLALPSPPQTSLRVPLLFGIGYLLLFVALDWVGFIRPLQGLNITPWNPQTALAIALLMRRPRWLWLVCAGLLGAELAVRGTPANWPVALVSALALGVVCAAMARTLALRLDPSLALGREKDLLWLAAIVVAGSLASGIVYVAAHAFAGFGTVDDFVTAVARYWIGDAVGIIVVLPVLLLAIDPARRAALLTTLRRPHWWAIAVATVGLLWFVFAAGHDEQFRFFYLLLLPVVWAAAKLGLAGAVLCAALTQLGLIVAVQSVPRDITVFQLQVLMAALTLTGLLLGIAVDERTRAAAELKGSLRMAAAGQMAAALAHELSQPLTALSGYAQAFSMLSSSATLDAQGFDRLGEIARRMVDDAHRASEVVKRLRDFFRTGSTQLRPVAPALVVAEAVEAHRRRAAALDAGIECDVDAGLPDVWMDPVQVAVVLRNLIANALDAASAAPGPARVAVRARAAGGELRVDVEDSGAGIDPARLQTLFDPGASDKPGGMGVGLSICRAIVEAHGGRLWAEPGPRGRLCFTLPLNEDEPGEVRDAA